jgi:hypothetical protein
VIGLFLIVSRRPHEPDRTYEDRPLYR